MSPKKKGILIKNKDENTDEEPLPLDSVSDDDPNLTQPQIASKLINHVQENIALTSKHKSIKEIQIYFRNLVKDQKVENIKKFKESFENEFVEISKQ